MVWISWTSSSILLREYGRHQNTAPAFASNPFYRDNSLAPADSLVAPVHDTFQLQSAAALARLARLTARIAPNLPREMEVVSEAVSESNP